MNCKMFLSGGKKVNCKMFSLWRIGELQNVFSGGGNVNCKMFSLVATRRTAKCISRGE